MTDEPLPDPSNRPVDKWLSPLIAWLDDAADALVADDIERALAAIAAARDWALSRTDV